jgi:hypothetical protein
MKAVVKLMLSIYPVSAFMFTSCESDDSKVSNQNPAIVSLIPDNTSVKRIFFF